MADEQTKKKVSKKKAAAKKAPAKKAEPKATGNSGKQIKVTLIRSLIGTIGHHRATVRGLGLRRMHHSVLLEDTPAIRGAVNKVRYMVRVEDVG